MDTDGMDTTTEARNVAPQGVDPFAELEVSAEVHRTVFADGHLVAPPQKHLAILTCMDARIDPLKIFGLARGDAHIMRNAGARASDDAIRSLVLSTISLGVDRIAVVHHTECGTVKTTAPELVDQVVARTGAHPGDVDFGLITDQEATIEADVQRIVDCPYLPPGTAVAGFLYDVRDGGVRRVTPTIVVRPDQIPRGGPEHG